MEDTTQILPTQPSDSNHRPDTTVLDGSGVPSSPEPDRNGTAATQGPRLASLTGLLLNQKPSKRWNNSTSSDSVSTKPSPPGTSDSDQTPSLTRTLRFEDDSTELRRTGSFSGTHRRPGAGAAGADKYPASFTDSDIRRFAFHHPRAKRLVSGLRVHAFTRQAFVSSFTVGLALGSVVAIVLKILKDVACRVLYS